MNGEASPTRWDLLQKRSLIVGFIALLFCGRRSADFSATFLSSLSVGVYFLDWHSGGMPGAAHVASSGWRALGLYDSARAGSGDTNPSTHGLALYPFVVRFVRSLPLGATRSCGRGSSSATESCLSQSTVFHCPRAVYFAIWIVLGRLLVKWSLEQDRTADGSLSQRLQHLADRVLCFMD